MRGAWLPWCTGYNFGSGQMDVLLVSSYGRIGIVETRLSSNPRKRREMVAQIVDYALSLPGEGLSSLGLPPLPEIDCRVNYKTAWRVKHKIMQAMAEREEARKLEGFVQLDDAYLGTPRPI